MGKRFSCCLLSVILFLGLLTPQVTATGLSEDAKQISAETTTTVTPETVETPASHQLFVDGVLIPNAKVQFVNGLAYIPLRAACMALRPDATLAWENGTAYVKANNLDVAVRVTDNYLTANERCLYLPYGVVLENGMVYLPAKTLATIFDATYAYEAATQSIFFRAGSGALMSADQFYDSDELYLMSHIIYAESGNQPLIGRIAVGNVILNRVAHPDFPNTIYDVIYQKNQFSPVKNGTIKLTPDAESIVAAKLCLEGAVVLSNALWFNGANRNSWAAKHKTYITTIGGHAFYV